MMIIDFAVKTPPAGVEIGLFFFYTYDGDCNSEAAKAQASQNMVTMGFCTGECTIDKLESYCGETSVVKRRRRSTTKQLSFKITIKVTTTNEEAIKDPTASNLITKMTTKVAPDVLAKIRNVKNWDRIVDSNIRSLDSLRSDGNPVKTCATSADVYNEKATVQEQCGNSYLLSFIPHS